MEDRQRALIKRIRIMTGRRLDSLFSGEYHSAFRGRGLAFDSVREYCHGDDVRLIDWNVSSRMNNLYVRQYIEERELSIVIALDVSASTRTGRTRSKGETLLEAAALFLYLAERNRDAVSVVLFSDRVEKFIRPPRGRRTVLRVLDEIVNTKPEGKKTDGRCALDFLDRVMKKRSVVFFMSDFLDMGDDWQHRMKVLGRRHDIIPVQVYDPLERKGTAGGLVQYLDLESGRTIVAERSAGENALPAFRGMEAIVLSTEEDAAIPILRFFEKRAAHRGRRAGGRP